MTARLRIWWLRMQMRVTLCDLAHLQATHRELVPRLRHRIGDLQKRITLLEAER